MVLSLPHRIRIESNAPTQDGTTGNITDVWSHFSTVYAHYRPASVREFVEAGIQQSHVVGAFRIRPLAGLLPSMRIAWGGRTYNIEGVLADARNGTDYYTLPVSEIANG